MTFQILDQAISIHKPIEILNRFLSPSKSTFSYLSPCTDLAFSASTISCGDNSEVLSRTSLSCFLKVALDMTRSEVSSCYLSCREMFMNLIFKQYKIDLNNNMQNVFEFLNNIWYWIFLRIRISNLINNKKMPSKLTNMNFIGFFILLSLSLTVFTQTPIDDDYPQYIENDIAVPTRIQIQKQQIKLVAEVTVPSFIQPPASIFPLYYSRIQNDTKHYCSTQQFDINKKIGDYIKFQKNQLGKFQGWPIQILDGAYSINDEKIYAILTNGSLIRSSLKKEIGSENKIFDFELFNYQKTSSDEIWELDKYELYTQAGKVYLFKDKQLFKAVFGDNNTWGMEIIQNATKLNKVYQYKDDLYLLNSSTIHKIQNGTVSNNLIRGQYLNSKKKSQFVDVSIDNGYMYILCKYQGIYLVNVPRNYEYIHGYTFDFHDFAYKIAAKNHTVLVNFKLYKKNFIGEFFFIPSTIEAYPPTLKLNKFYYRFDEMQNVVLFQNFGLVYSLSELNFFQHSINRNAPFGQLQTELIYRASYPKILDVIPLDPKNLRYILVEKNGIFVEQLDNSESNALLRTEVKCVFKEAGTYEISVNYEGFCKDTNKSLQSYCTKQNIYKFQVNDEKLNREVQANNDHMFLLLVLAVALVLVIGGILAYRKSTLKNRERLILLLNQRRNNAPNNSNSNTNVPIAQQLSDQNQMKKIDNPDDDKEKV